MAGDPMCRPYGLGGEWGSALGGVGMWDVGEPGALLRVGSLCGEAEFVEDGDGLFEVDAVAVIFDGAL